MRRTRNKRPTLSSEHIIPRHRHRISKTDIAPNALKVLNRLSSSGFEAYLVGGGVRDLLLGKMPKDFDVATNATPQQIKKLFRNARIIGRRFKLVHIIFHREIVEVATFRKENESESLHQLQNERGMLIRDNVYGTLEDDAFRRDFTINSLYYNLEESSIVDLTAGFDDVENQTVRVIGNPDARYREDPVRMMRAIRFSAKLHFKMASETAEKIAPLAPLLHHVSSSRLFDEVTKLYQCGESVRVQSLLTEHGLFKELFPETHRLKESAWPVNALLGIALENTDNRILNQKPVTPAFMMAVLLWFPVLERAKTLQETEKMYPLPALEAAMSQIVFEQNRIVLIPKRFVQVMREIWVLQFRFPKRSGDRAIHLLEHPRFRAAYDFLAIRALAGDAPMELADWWTSFQEISAEERLAMIEKLPKEVLKKPRKRRKKPKVKPAET